MDIELHVWIKTLLILLCVNQSGMYFNGTSQLLIRIKPAQSGTKVNATDSIWHNYNYTDS